MGDGGLEGAAGEAPDQRLPKVHRIRRRADFLRIQRHGRRVHTRHYLVVCLPREGASPGEDLTRFGVTVTRKVAGAVGRNRVKRVLREVFRRHHSLFPEACDVVVIAKQGAPELGFHEALDELRLVRAKLRRLIGAAGHDRRGAGG